MLLQHVAPGKRGTRRQLQPVQLPCRLGLWLRGQSATSPPGGQSITAPPALLLPLLLWLLPLPRPLLLPLWWLSSLLAAPARLISPLLLLFAAAPSAAAAAVAGLLSPAATLLQLLPPPVLYSLPVFTSMLHLLLPLLLSPALLIRSMRCKVADRGRGGQGQGK